jgi:hypothetical protein
LTTAWTVAMHPGRKVRLVMKQNRLGILQSWRPDSSVLLVPKL